MIVLFLAVLAAARLIKAQDDDADYHPHGAVAFIRTGERTPLIDAGTPRLSALGAQQMHTLGQIFRGRYIGGDGALTGIGQQPIKGLSPDVMDPEQLLVQTLDRPHLVASAQAFMQGLYPPFSDNSTELFNGSSVDFPLGGYQYAQIQAVSELDPQSVYIAGDQNCPVSMLDSIMYQTTDEYLETKTASESFYDSLNASIFKGHLSQDQVSYYNAFEIYDYLQYAYMHDRDVHDMLANDSTYDGVFDRLRSYADESAWYFWGNTSSSTADDDYRAMAGRTLAALVLGSFQKIWMNDGNATNHNSHPLTLLFGEQESFISLFSLMMVDFVSKNFRSIPPFGSAMIFELFSRGSSGDFPSDPNELWVHFYFQNGTQYDGDLQAYPMFNQGRSGTDMPWLDFQEMMSGIMTNTLTEWCSQCSSAALFCWGVDDSTIEVPLRNHGSQHKVSPAVAGAIGAVVTLAVAGILFALAMLVFGIRLHRVARRKESELGGFKGSAKLASDADLNLPRNGAAPAGIVGVGGGSVKKQGHERVGSWELKQKEFGPESGDESRRASFEAIEAAMSKPVEPSERV